ncbi:MAG: beta strand repeat-containing protein [Moraxellaceae bacterium]
MDESTELGLLVSWISGGRPEYAAPTVSVDSPNVSSSQYSVTFAGKGNGGGRSTTYYFDHGTSAAYGTSTLTVTPSDTGGGFNQTALFTRSLSNLACGTTYYFRPAALNNGSGSATGTGSTVATSACPTVTTISDVSTNEDSNISFSVASTNKGGGTTVSYALDATSILRGMTINASTGAFVWTAANSPDAPTSNTNYSVTVTATYTTPGSPDSLDTDVFTITISPVNDAPALAAIGAQFATEDTLFQYQGVPTDVDDANNGSALTWSLQNAPAGMSVSSTGLVSWTPANGVSSSGTVTLRVADGGENGAAAATQNFTVTVTAINDAPALAAIAAQFATEDTLFQYQGVPTDVDDANNGTALTWSLQNAPAGMSVSSTGLVTWTPPNGVLTSGTVTLRVADGGENGAAAATQNFTVTVTAVNDAPQISSSAPTSAVEASQFSHQMTVNDPDDANDGAELTWSLQNAPAGMLISSTGLITWTPGNGVMTSGTVTVRVADGGENGAVASTQNFTLLVTEVNQGPSLAAVAQLTATEDTLYSYAAQVTDIDDANNGADLVWSLQNAPSGMAISTTGVITWTPLEGVTTSGTVTVRVADGGENGAVAASRNFVIAVTQVNDQPVLSAVALLTATEDVQYSYQAVVSDSDDANNGTALSWSLLNQPSGMVISATGLITWTPLNGVLTSGTVTVRVADGGEDGSVMQSRTFAITVTPVNDAPVLAAISAQTATEDVLFQYQGVVTDVDDANNGSALSWSLQNAPAGMQVSNTGLVTWTPLNGVLTSGSVTLRVADGGEDGAAAASRNFTVTVTAVNDAPQIGNITDGTLIELDTLDIQVNVTDVDDANNGSALNWSLPGSHPAWVTISATGLLHLAPPQDSDGSYTITVRVADGGENSALPSSDTFLLTITRKDADADTIADYHDNCPNLANTNQANNDGDSEGDLCDSDDDNDGIPDVVEMANGLNPFSAADAALDLDGDGLSNLVEYQACDTGGDPGCGNISVDSVAPVITTGGDVTVVATGYYTALPSTNAAVVSGALSALAVDGNDGSVTVTADKAGPFRPGHHVLTWTARDRVGNTGTATQNIFVKPLASLGGTELVGINTTVQVPVRLNGETPTTNDVTVNYSVSGTAVSGTDFTALPGSITFAGGSSTVEYIPVVISGSVSTDKTLIITLTSISGDAALGESRQHTLAITRQSSPPQLSFRVEQNGEERQVVYRDDGAITVEALVTDPNGGPANCNSWQTGSLAVVIAGCTVTITPSAAAGSYTLTTTAVDTQHAVTRSVTLLLLNTRPTLTAADTDGDGLSNVVEGLVDSNHNGILDYLEAQGGEQPESILLRLGSGASLLLLASADTGLEMQAGRFALAAQSATTPQSGIQIFASQVANGSTVISDADYAAVGAIYDFGINGLSAMNTVAHVVLPLPVALPANAQWRQLSASGRWTSFAASGGDGIASAPRGADGQCPVPGAAAYQSGLIAGNTCVQLTITDGGANDADGLVNGSVSVTAAPTVSRAESASTPPTESQNGGAIDLYALVLLALALITLRRKELQR